MRILAYTTCRTAAALDTPAATFSQGEKMTIYWHGGLPGIKRGAYLLPPIITKSPSLSEFGGVGVHRRDRVYVTTSRANALLFAAGVRRGVIYECEPIGELEPDPDCSMPGLSWQCEKARVIRVIKPLKLDIKIARAVLCSGRITRVSL